MSIEYSSDEIGHEICIQMSGRGLLNVWRAKPKDVEADDRDIDPYKRTSAGQTAQTSRSGTCTNPLARDWCLDLRCC